MAKTGTRQRRKSVRDETRRQSHAINRARGMIKGMVRARKKVMLLKSQDADARFLINSMTNWQRNQWARSGCPGGQDKESKLIRPFTEMKRP